MVSSSSSIESLFAGEVRAVAQLLRAIDDRDPRARLYLSQLHQNQAEPTRAHSFHVIGITGSPGAGKSTVVDALIRHYRSQNQKVGVIAIDPSSPFSGGAILGDRIRMQQHTLDPGVFIRSLATRGALGGLSQSAADSAFVLGAVGYDKVLIETVGVGQGEVDICRVAQSVVVVMTPGAGDDIQAIKAGILEIADVYLVNKADREGASKVVHDLKSMMSLLPEHQAYSPVILESVALTQKGIPELASALAAHLNFLLQTDLGKKRESERRKQVFLQHFREEIAAYSKRKLGERFEKIEREVEKGADPYAAIESLLRSIAF